MSTLGNLTPCEIWEVKNRLKEHIAFTKVPKWAKQYRIAARGEHCKRLSARGVRR
jgi:hypothetical protein